MGLSRTYIYNVEALRQRRPNVCCLLVNLFACLAMIRFGLVGFIGWALHFQWHPDIHFKFQGSKPMRIFQAQKLDKRWNWLWFILDHPILGDFPRHRTGGYLLSWGWVKERRNGWYNEFNTQRYQPFVSQHRRASLNHRHMWDTIHKLRIIGLCPESSNEKMLWLEKWWESVSLTEHVRYTPRWWCQWIGLGENLQETPKFNGKNHGFLYFFP
jgi:hypothetical protein